MIQNRKYKILLVSSPGSSHTVKWANSLYERGYDIFVFGLSDPDPEQYNPGIKLETMRVSQRSYKRTEGSISKLEYLKVLPRLKSIVKRYQPNILHAHYATSHGLLGALTGFHPYIVSVWGNDVTSYPKLSILHNFSLKFILSKADRILSTSRFMAGETNKYTSKPVEVTPFGIDISVFRKIEVKSYFGKDEIVIGTIKSLEKQYGIEYLIEAFNILKIRNASFPIKLLIVGGGSLEQQMKQKVRDLNLENSVVFTGKVPYKEIQHYHNMIDIFAALSIEQESFGVAILEASACEIPVIISRIGGLPEVVCENLTGLIVPVKDANSTALAMEKLILNKQMRIHMGEQGRKWVLERYDWNDSINQMSSIYKEIIERIR